MLFFLQEAENYGKNVAIFASFALSDIPGKDLSQEFSSESWDCGSAGPCASLAVRPRGWAQQALPRRFHPRFPDRDIFPPKMAFSFCSRMFCAGKNTSAAFYSDCGVSAESGEVMGPSMETPTFFCNGRRCFSCCFLTVSPVAGLSTSRLVFWGFFEEKRNP